MVIGLTGGIGSGKSTVAALLAERGAVVIDVDAVGREVKKLKEGDTAAVGCMVGSCRRCPSCRYSRGPTRNCGWCS